MRSQVIMKDPLTKLIWSNLICEYRKHGIQLLRTPSSRADPIAVLLSITTGCVFLVLILYTYLHVRRKAVSGEKAATMAKMGFSFRLNRSETDTSGMPTKPAAASNMRSISYDRSLIARFLVFFALSNVLQVCLILYYMFAFDRYMGLMDQGAPDYSLHYTLDDLALTMPGVSSGLILFIVFGTTAPFRREYKKWLQPCRRKCQGREGPIMVAPLDSINAANNEALPPRRRSFDEGENDMADEFERRSSTSSTWELPPMDFDEFSAKEVLPRSALEQ